jgi:hypothetical protein
VNRRLLEYSPDFDSFSNWSAPASVAPGPGESAVDSEEIALAADLLGVRSEAELERVLRRVIGNAGVLGARVLRSPMGPSLIAHIKSAVLNLVPLRRSALLVVAGAPGRSAQIARGAQVFGLELEGLSPEDKEFALAQQAVRFADAVARNAGMARAGSPDAVREALRRAACRHAPGLLPRFRARHARQGGWSREGGRLVLHDC